MDVKTSEFTKTAGGGDKKQKEPPEREPDFDPVEKAEKERELYGKRNATEMYYPQELSHFHPTTGNEALPWEVQTSQKCDLCGTKSPKMRHLPKWTYWCVPCMKKNGFGRADKQVVTQRYKDAGYSNDEVEFYESQKTLPEEIIQQIFCYLPSFHDLCNVARVSRKWMNGLNYATSEESDLMKSKRLLLGKEMYIVSKSKDSKVVERAQEKQRQLELAPLLGEWQSATKQRKLALCRLIVNTKYYSTQLGITSNSYPAFDFSDSATNAEVMKRVSNAEDRKKTGNEHCGVATCRDMILLAPGRTTRGAKSETGMPVFEVEVDSKTLNRIVVFVDSETGWITTYDAVGKNKAKDPKPKSSGGWKCSLM